MKWKPLSGWFRSSTWWKVPGTCLHLGMFRAIGMAARFLFRSEFHHFDASAVWIVRVQTVFAIAADFRAIEYSQAVGVKLGRSIVNIFHAERKMILHSKLFVVSIGRNVEHVFDPVGAVRNLQFVPVDAVILEPAVPVEAESQKVNIETILRSHVFDHETRMDQARTDLLRRRHVSVLAGSLCTKAMGLPSGSRTRKDREPSESLLNDAGERAMRQQVTAHSHEIVGGEGNFCEPVFKSRILRLSRRPLQEYPLVRWRHKITGLRSYVVRTMVGESKSFGIELAGFLDVANIDRDVIDAENVWPHRLLFAARCKRLRIAAPHRKKKEEWLCTPIHGQVWKNAA